MDLYSNTSDYAYLWSTLTSVNTGEHVKPEKSNAEAWAKAEEEPHHVVFAGDLKFTNDPGRPIFQLQLKPLKKDRSYRLARKFGGDRFFVLGIPGLTERDLPAHLRKFSEHARNTIISWLLESDHHFLGRHWRAFFVKPQPLPKNRKANPNDIRYRIYLFAVDGQDFQHRSNLVEAKRNSRQEYKHITMTVQELLQWLIPFEMNTDQSCLKLFARITLGNDVLNYE